MMNSFGRQEGGGFRRREGKLVSPVRRDYPLHHKQNPATRKREKKQGGRRSVTPPLKTPPPERNDRRKRRKRMTKRKRGREGRAGEKKDVNERKK